MAEGLRPRTRTWKSVLSVVARPSRRGANPATAPRESQHPGRAPAAAPGAAHERRPEVPPGRRPLPQACDHGADEPEHRYALAHGKPEVLGRKPEPACQSRHGDREDPLPGRL